MTPLVFSYARERLLTPPIAGASVLLALATLPHTPGDVVRGIATAYLLVSQFRIWDDVEDRGVDAGRTPDRVLVRAGSIAPVVTCAAVCAAATAALILGMPASLAALAAYGLVTAGLLAYYRRRRSHSTASIAVLLLKYPAVALVVGTGLGTGPRRLALAMLAAYIAACAFEYLHDRNHGGFSGKAVLLLQAASVVTALVILRGF